MSLIAALAVAVAASALACAVTWLVLARLNIASRTRTWAALLLPLAAGGLLLWTDGAPFNGVFGVVAVLPALVVNLLVVLRLENYSNSTMT